MYSRFILIVSPLLLLAGCIKEDRSMCPMPLRVVPGRGAVEVPVHYHVGCDGDTVWNDVFVCAADSAISIDVPRKILKCFASRSELDYYDEYGNFIIPEGCESPEYWTHRSEIDAGIPVIADTVVLHRSCALLHIGIYGSGTGRKCGMMLTGQVTGFLCDGTPTLGTFCPGTYVSGDGFGHTEWNVCVPRQIDDSLLLEIEYSGAYRSFPLGRCLAMTGYDWTMEDLDDVNIEIDYQGSFVRVGTSAWVRTLSFDITF